jgi:predicted nucleotidyltransferase
MDMVERLRRVLDGRAGVRLAVLFGSTATKRRHARSDLDVGVMLDPDVDLPALGVELNGATGTRVELIPLDEAPPLLRFEIT